MQKQTRQAGETATASRRAAYNRLDTIGALLALAAFALLVAFKLIGGAA